MTGMDRKTELDTIRACEHDAASAADVLLRFNGAPCGYKQFETYQTGAREPIRCYNGADSATSLSAMKAAVDKAKSEKRDIVICYHKIVCIGTEWRPRDRRRDLQ